MNSKKKRGVFLSLIGNNPHVESRKEPSLGLESSYSWLTVTGQTTGNRLIIWLCQRRGWPKYTCALQEIRNGLNIWVKRAQFSMSLVWDIHKSCPLSPLIWTNGKHLRPSKSLGVTIRVTWLQSTGSFLLRCQRPGSGFSLHKLRGSKGSTE